MPLPVQAIRARREHRDLLQRAAEILRQGGEPLLRKLIEVAESRPVGPFLNETAALAFLRDRLVASLKPRAIWLFGSRARGDARPDSDFDLLVVLPDDLPREAYRPEHVSEPVIACGLGCDVVACSLAEFQRDRKRPGSLVERAVSEGRAIYRDPRLRAAERAAR